MPTKSNRVFIAACLLLTSCGIAPPPDDAVDGQQESEAMIPDPAGPGEDESTLLGRNFWNDPVVTAITRPSLENCKINSAGHFACPSRGVDFVELDVDGSIEQVRFYPNAVGYYRPSGMLPFGLHRGDNRAAVNSKLGVPDTRLDDTDIYTLGSQRAIVTYYSNASPQAGLIRYLTVLRIT